MPRAGPGRCGRMEMDQWPRKGPAQWGSRNTGSSHQSLAQCYVWVPKNRRSPAGSCVWERIPTTSRSAAAGRYSSSCRSIRDQKFAGWCSVRLRSGTGKRGRARALFLKGTPRKKVIVKNFRDGFFPYQGEKIKEYFETLKKGISPDLIFTHYGTICTKIIASSAISPGTLFEIT